MQLFDVFKSEGGFRVCGALWAGGPVISSSPWFATREQAEASAQKMNQDYSEQTAELKTLYGVS